MNPEDLALLIVRARELADYLERYGDSLGGTLFLRRVTITQEIPFLFGRASKLLRALCDELEHR